ncbi:EH domain-containing protein 4-like [Salvelinus fontinalis]|uniref:EH domain-containing protein 4 n=3 Tax=Salmoninae TaxID=504568 RepID=B5X0R0_SALSA|nr:EH domain-containing protein 4 [Salmo salar]XP_029568929.1 EH domain-containing protein 4-like [Salmo trutta]XP_038823407.1 EH domain-containing protein 4-like [Salvelinus namaycush]XP_055721252.1 EH domain-containing protein 4-like [Salvelinus fontinalis]ACI32891.1 EH domain-containing protein 4 [Salmo salar]|eukprot:NP_001133244.1 EH domain-containing protein 4 [Salmo salar]
MFSWVNKEQGGRNKDGEMYQTVTEGLQQLYSKKLFPLEETYLFHDFHSPALEAADFQSKPMVLLVGQYSTGKTTFIRYLLEQDFPGMRIGPEPTTDGFIAVMYGENEGIVPGNALVVDPKKPFRKLNAFGNAFLNRFICSQMPNQVLQGISIIDTPGILSGEKQRVSRGYDFSEVLRWFGERVDRIILLFDAHKLDISDEFSEAIKAFRGQDDKIRVVLNKADQVDSQQLMRVYGALMWSLGKVINTPEVVRVYLGSFWAKPLQNTENRRLFEAEAQDLFKDIQGLPRNAALRKLNDLIKRARLAKVHAYIISYLKKEMPSLFGKEKKKEELIMRLPEIYTILQREHHISPGDFPNVVKMQEQLQHYDFSKFPSLKMKLIESVDKMLANKISGLMTMIRDEESMAPPAMVSGGAFEGSQDGPFGQGYGEGISAGSDCEDWIVSRDKHKYDEIFYSMNPINGKISGVNAKKEMMSSSLPNTVLGKIWKLADCDKDGMLDDEEFALAQHLIKVKLEGYELPTELPHHLVPPAHRKNEVADILYNHDED